MFFSSSESEETLQRVKRDDDDDDKKASGPMCPCAQGCCEQGWIQYRDACYKAEAQKKTWNRAEEHCLALESNLASVHSDEEDNFILHLTGNTKSKRYWLGGRKIRQGEESHWAWADDSPFLYKQPTTVPAEHGHLAALRADNRGTISWVPRLESETNPFVCKYILA
ncbi:UNVERIFIED_CONTAM: hypothetical protein K2H54_033228 [Gekko kuhli]